MKTPWTASEQGGSNPVLVGRYPSSNTPESSHLLVASECVEEENSQTVLDTRSPGSLQLQVQCLWCSELREGLGQSSPEPGLCTRSGVITDRQEAKNAGKRPLHGLIDHRNQSFSASP